MMIGKRYSLLLIRWIDVFAWLIYSSFNKILTGCSTSCECYPKDEPNKAQSAEYIKYKMPSKLLDNGAGNNLRDE